MCDLSVVKEFPQLVHETIRFKTPAPFFNVNSEHADAPRRLFINRYNDHRSILSREVVVGCGGSYCQGVKKHEHIVITNFNSQ
jgi:hypothetical protein